MSDRWFCAQSESSSAVNVTTERARLLARLRDHGAAVGADGPRFAFADHRQRRDLQLLHRLDHQVTVRRRQGGESVGEELRRAEPLEVVVGVCALVEASHERVHLHPPGTSPSQKSS